MTIDAAALAQLIGLTVIVMLCVVVPLRRSYDHSDTGRGNLVVLPPPDPVTLRRPLAFIAVGFVSSVILIGFRYPSLADTYRSWVSRITEAVIRQPDVVAGYTQQLIVIVPLSIIAFVVAQAVCLRASLGRRLMILAHAPLALLAALLLDSLLAVATISTGVHLGPAPIVSLALHFGIAYLLAMRLALTTYQLPRPTQVPILRRHNLRDDAVLLSALVLDLLIVVVSAVLFLHWAGNDPLAYGVVLIVLPAYLKFGLYGVLSTFSLFGPRVPNPDGSRPPVTVIGPAYNEEINIVAWVRSIDAAAARYGGPVRVVMCDDGSTDHTVALCEQAFAQAAHLTGQVVRGAHGGKAEALNIALGAADTEIVIRHDTDCLLDPDAIRYTVPWFVHRPDVGLVGAFMLPKMPLRTWIDRMRAIELVTGFGLPRVGFAVVDSQPCVPGNYTAFRREPAVAIGGWVSGMFGEDIDFTCNLARLGYRAVYDRRVWAYEDVPDTIFQLRTQRRRWNRGSLQNFARFVPPAAGLAGPRFWFAEFLRAARRLIMPMQFIGFIYLLANVLINATPGLNLGRLLAFYVVAKLPLFALTVLSLNYRRLGRVAWWYPLYLFFAFLKRFANLECMLSMPVRRVQLPGRIRVSSPVETTRWPGLRPTALVDE